MTDTVTRSPLRSLAAVAAGALLVSVGLSLAAVLADGRNDQAVSYELWGVEILGSAVVLAIIGRRVHRWCATAGGPGAAVPGAPAVMVVSGGLLAILAIMVASTAIDSWWRVSALEVLLGSVAGSYGLRREKDSPWLLAAGASVGVAGVFLAAWAGSGVVMATSSIG